MHHSRKKQQIASDNPELVLCDNGDFKIKADLVEQSLDLLYSHFSCYCCHNLCDCF